MPQIHVAMVDYFQSVIDGHFHRLEKQDGIEIVASGRYGNDIESILANHDVDVILLGLSLPVSRENVNQYPIINKLPTLATLYPALKIIVISGFNQPALVKTFIDFGVNGYIYKDDDHSIQLLAQIVRLVANGGVYFSPDIYEIIGENGPENFLTSRQMEALSLCVAYPDMPSPALAKKLGITGSTFRNLMSNVYSRLKVRTRAAAITRAQQLGIIPFTGDGNWSTDHLMKPDDAVDLE